MLILDYIAALPDSFNKTTTSNNYKLLQLVQSYADELRDDIDQVDETADIHKATGKTLDLYGEMYDQARGRLTDEQMRYIILQMVGRNMVTGSCNSIVEALAVAFGVEPSEFKLVETENPLEVEVKSLPYTIILENGLTAGQMLSIINLMLPVCVTLKTVELTGTFEFSDNATTQDEAAGFGNVEQTVGGYLGILVSGEDSDIPL